MAIKRRITPGPSSTGNRTTSNSFGGAKALQNTVWDWLVPQTPLIPIVTFDLVPYASATSAAGAVTIQDVLEILGTGNFQTCNFPVYPSVGLSGLLVRTNIPDFTQYADAPLSNIPVSLAETIEVSSDKAQYIGCDNGGGNISQSGLRIKATPKINGISSLPGNEVIVSLDISNLAQNVFVNQGNQEFFPYNESVAPQAGVLIPIDSYLNNGQIGASGIYARHLPSSKNTSKTSLSSNFNFSLG